jgi:hypothetical protein
MIRLDRCLNVTLDGFVVETDDENRKRNPAGIGILLDGGQDTGPGPHIGGSCNLRRMRHVAYAPKGAAPLDVEATFIAIGLTTRMNQEFHRIIECGGNGAGRGRFLQVGANPNSKDIKLLDSWYIDGYRHAVHADGGSLLLERNNMSNNEWDLWLDAGDASVGYVREYGHIGEHSTHHAFVNMPFHAHGGTYDTVAVRPRSQIIHDPIFDRKSADPNIQKESTDYEECWILFGFYCAEAHLHDLTLSTMLNPDARVFGFMNNGVQGRIELGPFNLGPHHTTRTLGIDQPSLDALRGVPKITFHNRAANATPTARGVIDLACGEFVYNDRGRVNARTPALPTSAIEPTHVMTADAPKPWNQISRGETQIYQAGNQLMFRHVDSDGRRKQGVVGTESVSTGQ